MTVARAPAGRFVLPALLTGSAVRFSSARGRGWLRRPDRGRHRRRGPHAE